MVKAFTVKASLQPVVFAQEPVDPPLPSTFIVNPRDRVVQCLKVLCGNYSVVVDDFISLYIGQKGVSTIIKQVLETLDPEFLRLLALPQDKGANATAEILKPLDLDSTEKVVYMGALSVPANARFGQNCRDAFPVGAVDEASEQDMMYIGSAAGKDGARGRVGRNHENDGYRQKNPSLFYSAVDEPGTSRNWRRVGAAKQDEECQALIRITEALAIATLQTYTSPKYTALLREYGIVEEGS